MSIPNISPRDRIMKTVGPLFYREGYRAIGVDRIIAESGVAKATFYKHTCRGLMCLSRCLPMLII
jgi:AcrR family transcriptional regulator